MPWRTVHRAEGCMATRIRPASLHGVKGNYPQASLARSERRKLPPHCLQHQCIYNVLHTAARGHAPPLLCKLLSFPDTPEISSVACRFYGILLDLFFPRICLKPRYSTRLSLKQPLHTQRSPKLFCRLGASTKDHHKELDICFYKV